MATVYISLGANCGNREETILAALEILSRRLIGLQHCNLYETPDYCGTDRPYINCVAKARTELNIGEFDSYAKHLEVEFGRTPEARSRGDVPLDIDLVVYDEQIIKPKDFSRYFFSLGYNKLKDCADDTV